MNTRGLLRKVDLNVDKIIILLLPILFALSLLVFKGKALFFTCCFIISFLFYELIVYRNRKKYGLSGLKIISIPSLTTFTYTIFIALPGIYIASINVNNVYPFYLSILLYYLIFPAGLYLGEIIWPINNEKFLTLHKKNLQIECYENIIFKLLILLFFVCIGGLLLYLYRVDKIPLLELLKTPGAYDKAFLLREESFKLLNVTLIEKYFFNWLRNLLFPIGLVGSLYFAIVRKKISYRVFFVIFFILGLITNTLTLEKSPSAGIILAIASLIFFFQKKISLKFVLLTIFFILLFPALLLILVHASHSHLFRLIYITLWNRLILTPSNVLYQYFAIFPQKHDFLLGRSTQLFSWMFEKGLFPLNNYVAKIWWQIPTTTGSANAIYMCNFWADFGYYGLIFPHFILGVIFFYFYQLTLKVSRYRLNIIYILTISSTVPIFTFCFFSSNFTVLFFTRGLLFVIIILVFIKKYLKINEAD